MKKVFYVSMVIAILLATMVAANASISMWFATSGGADAGSNLNVVSGSTFTVYVSGSASANSGLGLALKIGTTTGSVGTTATQASTQITFATKTGVGLLGADAAWSSQVNGLYQNDLLVAKTAGLRTTSGVKNWGAAMTKDTPVAGINTPDFGPIAIASFNLKNNMAVGGTYTLELVSGAAGNSSYCTFINAAGAVIQNNATDLLTITSIADLPQVPEPGSLLALGSGLAGLVGFVIRKRK